MPTFTVPQVLNGDLPEAQRVVIADTRCDWVGVGIARSSLAREGRQVVLALTGANPAETVQSYVRDQSLGLMQQLKVELRPHLHAFGADNDTVYFRRVTTGEPVMLEHVGLLVLAYPPISRTVLADHLRDVPFEVVEIGDCLAPRTAEEAVLEGLTAGAAA